MNDSHLHHLEVELKFALSEPDALQQLLKNLGAVSLPIETHADTYYAHPARDFVVTGEAMRIRRVDGIPYVTYKGPKQSGPVKVRRELEWALAPGDADGSLTEEFWQLLGFRPVATVHKRRQPFSINRGGNQVTVTIDFVADVGSFAEIERVVTAEEVDAARDGIISLAAELGLHDLESRSYLVMLLASRKIRA